MGRRRRGRALTAPLRVLQVVHGFPPLQNAGTEQYAAMVADGLRSRGHTVQTFAATIDPARPMYSTSEEDGVTRLVNNLPGRESRSAASDPAVDAVFARVLARFRPDLIHVQHLMGLSVSLPREGVPTVWTLHDAWGWCAAGGTLLTSGERVDELVPCHGPGAACASCASRWMRDPPAVDGALRIATGVGKIIDPSRLHAAWKRVPGRLRARVTNGAPQPLVPAQILERAAAFRRFAAGCTMVSPSRFLADAATANGLGTVVVLPQGLPGAVVGSVRATDAPFVFLGTLAKHKGPDLVRAAWELAGRPAPLRVHGPTGPDPAFVVPNDGPIAHGDVHGLLQGARALVVGSIWPENSPFVILEARRAGCPIVAPNIGGIPEIVKDGVDGWLYAAGDVAALAACLKRPLPAAVRPPPAFDDHLDGLLALYAGARSKPVT